MPYREMRLDERHVAKKPDGSTILLICDDWSGEIIALDFSAAARLAEFVLLNVRYDTPTPPYHWLGAAAE